MVKLHAHEEFSAGQQSFETTLFSKSYNVVFVAGDVREHTDTVIAEADVASFTISRPTHYAACI